MKPFITESYQALLKPGAVFTILIPSWNNLPFLKLCVESIRRHSRYPHDVIIHVNEGSDGTLTWIRSQPDLSYTISAENIGVCYALNAAESLAQTEWLLYLNDDMYVCPDWDQKLWEVVNRIGHSYFYLSATMIEPMPQSSCSVKGDFGSRPQNFREQELLQNYASLSREDWQGSTWPPSLVHRNLWRLVGGYSTEFSPGMYSDPDFSFKLWKAGVRWFQGVGASTVYHFGSVSTRKVSQNKGYRQFIQKWGITSGTFTRYYLRRGHLFQGPVEEPILPLLIQCKNFFKRLLLSFQPIK
jgi:GT2 family glycosyltransferase